MSHFVMLSLTASWVGCNVYLWSLKQSELLLFCESIGMGAIAFPALYFYAVRQRP